MKHWLGKWDVGKRVQGRVQTGEKSFQKTKHLWWGMGDGFAFVRAQLTHDFVFKYKGEEGLLHTAEQG